MIFKIALFANRFGRKNHFNKMAYKTIKNETPRTNLTFTAHILCVCVYIYMYMYVLVRNGHILPSNLLNLNPPSTPRYYVPCKVPL